MKNVSSQIESKIMLEVRKQVWHQVKLEPVWYRVSGQIEVQVLGQVKFTVRDQVWHQLRETA